MSIAMPALSRSFVRTVVAVGIVAALVSLGIHLAHTRQHPARGYTSVGLTLGILAAAAFLAAIAYAWRKRAGQEHTAGRLDAWLWVHVVVSVVAIGLAGIHAGFDLTGRSGTWTLGVFIVVIGSGIVGWWRYRTVPAQVAADTGNLAADATQRELDAVRQQIREARAGRSKEFQFLADIVRDTGGLPDRSKLPPHEAEALLELHRLMQRQDELTRTLRQQLTLKRRLRNWLWVHVPASLLAVPLLGYHIYDGLELRHIAGTPHPADFASPDDCASCHARQYSEWIGSMHAIAQSSPVTDLQTRLVLELEHSGATGAAAPKTPVGDFCEKCHAPTGTVASPTEAQFPLIDVEARAPASQFGVSCATCHQMTFEGDMTFEGSPHGPDHPFRNNLGQGWKPGRTYFGPFGDAGDRPSIGNDYHQGVADTRMRNPEFCATCHTVTVDNPDGSTRFALQNTYMEWRGEPEASLQWQSGGTPIHCMTCHSTDLGPVTEVVRDMQRARLPLRQRLAAIRALLEQHQAALPSETAAIDDGSHDAPLPPRSRFRHTFTGVDYHLEPDLPYPRSHPLNGSNPQIQQDNLERVAQLLQMSTAVRIVGIDSGSNLQLEVMNLATGHHFPAGFAFAREAWFEIAVSPSLDGDDWRVLEGGRSGRPLLPNERLNKCDPGTRNFQAVLYDSVNQLETVLQNETDGVLKTPDQFRAHRSACGGPFIDREQFLKPGEIRTLAVPISGNFSDAQRLRVRMRFRNLPPEFLQQLAQRFRNLPDPDEARAQRAERLVQGLCIFDIAQDIISVDGSAPNDVPDFTATCGRP